MWECYLGRLANKVVHLSVKHHIITITSYVLIAGYLFWYGAVNLAINTDNADLLSRDLPFRTHHIEIKESFPQLSNNIIVVVDALTTEQADYAALKLFNAIKAKKKLFPAVFYPAGERYFTKNSLLFLDKVQLRHLMEHLIDHQFFIGRLAADPSLRGLFNILTLALNQVKNSFEKNELIRFMDMLTRSLQAGLERPKASFSWQNFIGQDAVQDPKNRRFIILKPNLDYGSLQPAQNSMSEIRRLASSLKLTPAFGIRVRLTGTVPMEQEELASVVDGMGVAGVTSFVLVLTLLFVAMRSFKMVISAILTLIAALGCTVGFAAWAVGSLNLISVAFIVLFIGLSVDFAIHFCLRIREEIIDGKRMSGSAPRAAGKIAGALCLCTATAMIAFFSFWPTNYVGLAELGIISGAGMLIALIVNLTFFPALLKMLGFFNRSTSICKKPIVINEAWQVRHSFKILIFASGLTIGASLLAVDVRFDFDPLNLKDPETQSVSTMLDLMNKSDLSLYSADILTKGPTEAIKLTQELKNLPTVGKVVNAFSFIPVEQSEKLSIISEAKLLILPALYLPKIPKPSEIETRKSIAQFLDSATKIDHQKQPKIAFAAKSLIKSMQHYNLENLKEYKQLEENLLGNLPNSIEKLKEMLSASSVVFDDVPISIRQRFVDKDNRWRVEVHAAKKTRDPDNLITFVDELKSVAPTVTGSPVIIVEASRVVVQAFLVAAVISIGAISILLLILLRRIDDVLLTFVPLVLATLLTGAASVLLDMPFNFANIIVLPLIFGLGVSSMVHLIMRSDDFSIPTAIFLTSTPRAVKFSALTTIGSFSTIALSSHPGTSSMGVLLAVSIGFTLASSLILLPALLVLRKNFIISREN